MILPIPILWYRYSDSTDTEISDTDTSGTFCKNIGIVDTDTRDMTNCVSIIVLYNSVCDG